MKSCLQSFLADSSLQRASEARLHAIAIHCPCGIGSTFAFAGKITVVRAVTTFILSGVFTILILWSPHTELPSPTCTHFREAHSTIFYWKGSFPHLLDFIHLLWTSLLLGNSYTKISKPVAMLADVIINVNVTISVRLCRRDP